jgi:histidyl-tRNA synthetase
LAVALRRLGVAVERDASGSAFGKQLKRAQRGGAAWVAVIGDEEVASGQLRLKRLSPAQAASECNLPLDDLASLASRVGPGRSH